MKTKICHLCKEEHSVLYRVQVTPDRKWVFCCKSCTEKSQSLSYYKYGGTWKGSRH